MFTLLKNLIQLLKSDYDEKIIIFFDYNVCYKLKL